jgi:trimeric autotransporter adhesin
MSTKTTFKRVALVAVAALGFGMLSVVPSSAAVTNKSYGGTITVTTLTSTPTAGKAVNLLVNFKGFCVATPTNPDQIEGEYFSSVISGAPTGSAALTLTSSSLLSDTTTATADTTYGVKTLLPVGGGAKVGHTAAGAFPSGTGNVWIDCGGSSGTYSVYELLSFTPDVAGTYNIYTVDPDNYTWLYTTTSIVVAAKPGPSAASTVVATAGTGASGADTVASPMAAPKTASTTNVVSYAVTLKNGTSNEVAAGDSPAITASVSGPGVVSWDASGVFGKSVSSAKGATTHTLLVRPDGQTGVSTITLSWTDASLVSTTIATKTVIFYGTTAKATASANSFVVAMDGSLKDQGGSAEIYLEDSTGNPVLGAAALITGTSSDAAVLQNVASGDCAADALSGPGYYACDVKGTPGVASGKSASITLKVTSAGTLLATASPVSFKTGGTVVYSASLAFDAASYAPGEKGYVIITMKDKYGNPVADGDYHVFNSSSITATAFAGLTTNQQITTSIFAATACTVGTSTTVVCAAGSTTGNAGYIWAGGSASAGTAKASFYAPFSSGSFLVKGTTSGSSADLSTDLKAGGYGTSISATVEIVNPATAQAQAATDAASEATDAANAATDAANAAAEAADAATAAAQDAADAVAALSAQVATLISDLKAQLTSLTNLVIKIQKKVKA